MFVVIAPLASCGTVPVKGPHFSEESPTPAGQSTLYLFNLPSYVGGGACPEFKIDGSTSSVALPNGSYARIDLSPGVHAIKAQTSWCFAMPIKSKVTTQQGERVFVKLTTREKFWAGATQSTVGNWWTGFEIVPEAVGLSQISELGRTN